MGRSRVSRCCRWLATSASHCRAWRFTSCRSVNSRSGQKFWRSIADGALDFSFFPTAATIAGSRIKAVFAGEGEKARKETDQPAIVFGDSGRQIVIGNLACDTTQRGERMHVAADEGLETLTVGELQVQHAAVRFDQGESIEFALVAGVIEHAEVSPIDFEALAWRRFHAQKGAAGFQLGTGGVHIFAQDGVSAAIAEWPQSSVR